MIKMNSILLFFLVVCSSIFEILNSAQRDDVDLLFDWGVNERYHRSGPCTLWWPLDGVEMFYFNIKEEEIIKFEVLFYCTDLSKVYSADIQLNDLNTLIPDIKPLPKQKSLFKISVPNDSVSFQNNFKLTVYENSPISGGEPRLASKFQIEFKILDSNSFEYTTISNIESFPTAQTLMINRPREHFVFLLNTLNLTNIAVEVGVDEGLFSEKFLSNWKGKRYLMIDPWREVEEEDYVDNKNLNQEAYEVKYNSVVQRLSSYENRAKFLRLTSLDAAKLMADGMLDFVYIDARHDYVDVMIDIMAWWPKVKKGGNLAGHDYQMHEVRYAVTEFCLKLNLLLNTCDANTSWFIFKL